MQQKILSRRLVMPQKIYRHNIVSTLQLAVFVVCEFCAIFQWQVPALSPGIIPAIAVFFLLHLFNRENFFANLTWQFMLVVSVYYIYLAYILFVSGISQIEAGRIRRFFLILVMLPLFFFIDYRKNYETIVRILSVYLGIQGIIQILLFLTVILFQIPMVVVEEVAGIRPGMSYSDGYWLHIMNGNGTPMLVLFMLRAVRKQKLDLLNAVLFVGIFIAGNFAYLLGLFCFLIYFLGISLVKKKEWYIYITLFFLVILTIGMAVSPYVLHIIELKALGSNPKRVDQAKVLLTTGNVFSGNGFGASIDVKTGWDYTGDIYFELQTLYIINQIGVIGYCLFMFCTIYIFYKRNGRMLPIYVIYLIFTFWNPYCFDSSHMVTAALLIGNRQYGTARHAA